jgi:hypothetical protein
VKQSWVFLLVLAGIGFGMVLHSRLTLNDTYLDVPSAAPDAVCMRRGIKRLQARILP